MSPLSLAPGYHKSEDYEDLDHPLRGSKGQSSHPGPARECSGIDMLKVTAQDNLAGLKPRGSEYAAFYFPWIWVRDPLSPIESRACTFHLPGILPAFGRVGCQPGVRKAPAERANPPAPWALQSA